MTNVISRSNTIPAFVGTIALMVAVVATYTLVSRATSLSHRLDERRASYSSIPQFGSLTGRGPATPLEWKPGRLTRGRSFVVLFGISAEWTAREYDYWHRTVESPSAVSSEIEFVGVCISNSSCDIPSTFPRSVALLTSMDPAQMIAVSTAHRQGRALLFVDFNLSEALPISHTAEQFATEISAAVSKRM